jgi:cardiolipin synthase
VLTVPDGLGLALFGASQWAMRIGAVVVVPFRRSPEAAKGWLLLFMLAPWPAFVLYTFIGRARHPKWRRDRVKKLPTIIADALGDARRTLSLAVCQPPPQLVSTAALGQAIGRQPPVAGSTIELEPVYDRVIARLAEDIDNARDHAHLMFYIFSDDAAGKTILGALERASQRGVVCRLMIDAIGSSGSRRAIAKRLAHSDVKLEIMLPVRFWGKFGRADMRNHRKVAVVDGCIGWVGSQNIIDAQSEATVANRELMLRVTGPIVAELQVVFIGDWYLETETALRSATLFPTPAVKKDGGIAQIVASGPDYPRARVDMLFVSLIESARHRVILTTPYFIPSEPLLFALRAAALRGLKVLLIVSAASDSRFIDLAQGSYFDALLEVGAQVSECRTNFLHAKHMTVDDDIALVGSSNMDMRSFELNSEVTLVSYDREVVRQLHDLETQYLAGSHSLLLQTWRARGFAPKVAGNIARLLSPLL